MTEVREHNGIIWVVGDRCYAPWDDGLYYPARITDINKNGSFNILFDDGVVLNNTRDILDHDSLGNDSENENQNDLKGDDQDDDDRAHKKRKLNKKTHQDIKERNDKPEREKEPIISPKKDEYKLKEKEKKRVISMVEKLSNDQLKQLVIDHISGDDIQSFLKEQNKKKDQSIKQREMLKFVENIESEIATFSHWKFKKGTGVATNATPLVQQCEAIATTFPNEAFQGMARILDFICDHLNVDDSYGALSQLSTECDEVLLQAVEKMDDDSENIFDVNRRVFAWNTSMVQYALNLNSTVNYLEKNMSSMKKKRKL